MGVIFLLTKSCQVTILWFMKTALQLADELETIANNTKNEHDWKLARQAIDLAWKMHNRDKESKNSAEDDIEFARRHV